MSRAARRLRNCPATAAHPCAHRDLRERNGCRTDPACRVPPDRSWCRRATLRVRLRAPADGPARQAQVHSVPARYSSAAGGDRRKPPDPAAMGRRGRARPRPGAGAVRAWENRDSWSGNSHRKRTGDRRAGSDIPIARQPGPCGRVAARRGCCEPRPALAQRWGRPARNRPSMRVRKLFVVPCWTSCPAPPYQALNDLRRECGKNRCVSYP